VGCSSGFCGPGHICKPAHCDNGVQDPGQGEIGVDCGGSCGACLDDPCINNIDCASGYCNNGVCDNPTCSDEVTNGYETDVDCAGVCPLCEDGKACFSDLDCISGKCTDGLCEGKPPTFSCDDGQQNGDETGVDCGGSCDPCVVEPEPTCEDGEKNQDESDVDCGGVCEACGLGDDCVVPSDCDTGACQGGKCCTINACGECATTPLEICNGLDDDCDGETDEALDGPLCDVQTGVCEGAVALCSGPDEWQCQDAAYEAWSIDWEADEDTCDTQDNDCDGEVDELECGFCSVKPVSNEITHVDGTDTLVSTQSYAFFEGEQYAVMTNPAKGPLSDLYLIRRDGEQKLLDDTARGLPSIATDGEAVYVGSVEQVGGGRDAVVWKVAPGPVTEAFRIKTSPLVPTAIVAARAGELAVVFYDTVDGHRIAKNTGSGWKEQPFPTTNPQLRLEYDEGGELHGLWKTDALNHKGPKGVTTIANGDTKRFDLAAATGGGMHAAYGTLDDQGVQTASYVFWNVVDGWSEPLTVGEGARVAIAQRPNGTPWVAWYDKGESMHVSRITDGKAYDMGLVNLDLQQNVIPWWTTIQMRIGVREHGILHVGAVMLVPDSSSGSWYRFDWWCPGFDE